MTDTYELSLYINKMNGRHRLIIVTVSKIMDDLLKAPYRLKVIDILKQPETAELNDVITTPTLVIKLPSAERHKLGELLEMENLPCLLDLRY